MRLFVKNTCRSHSLVLYLRVIQKSLNTIIAPDVHQQRYEFCLFLVCVVVVTDIWNVLCRCCQYILGLYQLECVTLKRRWISLAFYVLSVQIYLDFYNALFSCILMSKINFKKYELLLLVKCMPILQSDIFNLI